MAAFSATTTKFAPPFTPDPQLFLFDTIGGLAHGVVYNSNFPPGTATIDGSLLPNPSSYPPGDYLLGYSAANKLPYDSASMPIFLGGPGPQQLPLITTALHHWDLNGSGMATPYTITLVGAEFCAVVPEPTALALLGPAVLTAISRRRR
jgi:hypothetical protein